MQPKPIPLARRYGFWFADNRNMTEIKFRAWDKKTKKMRAVNTISFHYENAAFDYDDSRLPKVIYVWGTEIIGEYAPKPIVLYREPKDIMLMQFTGLRTKNKKKEIYENDILEDDGQWYEVTWCNYRAAWLAKGIKGTDHDIELAEIAAGRDCCLVGNIYENPELLKEATSE